MSRINFPTNPSLNDVYSFADRSWSWNGRSWKSISAFVGFTGSQGLPGEAAAIGYTGSRGFVGSAGAGFTGSRGNTGFTGSQGIPGTSAAIGFTGSSAPGHVNLYQSGALVVTPGVTRWYAPYNLVVTSIIPRVVIAANDIIKLDIRKNDESFIELTIPSGEFNGPPYTTEFNLLLGDFLTVAVTQVGTSQAPGGELYVQFQFRFV
jgi:hypothetical protein